MILSFNFLAAVLSPPARVISRLFVGFWLFVSLACVPFATQAADGIEFVEANVDFTDEGYRLSTEFSLELTRSLEEALVRGVPLYFTTQVEISRPRWYWFDDVAVSKTRTVRISYNLLTRQYRAAVDGNLYRTFSKLEEVLALLRRPSRWIIADSNALKRGETYTVALQMGLDVAQLPKPIQVSAISSNDWRLSSGWMRFPLKAEGK